MDYAVQRRFPRIPFKQSAEIEFLDRGRGRRVTCQVAVRSVACEGMGLAPTEAIELARKSRVNVSFAIEGETLSLPAAVAWASSSGVGVHLLLELARPEARQRWAHWIVEKTSAHNRARRRTRTSKKFIVGR